MVLQPLEVWGGLECTIARVSDRWRNQIEETGHAGRPGDLQAIRSLGIETLRYPVLMEAVAPDHPDQCDWGWSDQRFAAMRRQGLRPIAGLLHHGSGPRYTSLLDPALPDLLAAYADKVARRYPWINRFTPVNEPLTTARFSALYGHWYPHAADFGHFLRAVVIQCKATLLAMQAIRRVNPAALLVQTEDIGRTFSTAALQTQADHENERRWLSLDLLCGRVDGQHPWRRILREHGTSERDIDLFREGEGAPDVIGVNHYLTSERYLDSDVARYPVHTHGTNGRQVFADVEAVRIRHLSPDSVGPVARLRDVWTRYGRPMAITEVHHGCTREEQLRWLSEVWQAAQQVRQEGADIRAVTVWALFGTFDWNTLLTQHRGCYEPGVFDVRAPAPRQTALAAATSSLVATGNFTHPVMDVAGWWHRSERYYGAPPEPGCEAGSNSRALLILGDSPLAGAVARICRVRGLAYILSSAGDLGETESAIPGRLARSRCWGVVDAGSVSSLAIARACADAGLPFVTFSSDRVFDGTLERPYVETDTPNPTTSVGRRYLDQEQACTAAHPGALIVRTGPLINAWDPENFAMQLMNDAAIDVLPLSADHVVSPAYVPDLAHAVLDLLIDGETGIWHLPNVGWTSLSDLAARLSPVTSPSSSTGPTGRRNFALRSCRGWPMPSLNEALNRFCHDAPVARRSGELLAAE